MAYTINLFDGTLLTTVADGTIDTAATNIKLIGKNFTGYGELIDENFVHMLENFADVTPPTTPLVGQIWWNSAIGTLTVFDGIQFKAVSSSTVSDTEPTGAVEGDLWWDSTNEQLFVYNSTDWVLIGPSAAAGAGQSGAIVEIITDDVAADHVVVSTYVADSRIFITSGDATFTPDGFTVPALTGFTDIEPGLNLVSEGTLTGVRYNGTATNSDALNSIASGQFLRSDVDDETTAILKVVNDTGLRVGVNDDIQIGVTGTTAYLFNRTKGEELVIATTESIGVGGANVTAFTINPDNETISLANIGNGTGQSRIINQADPLNAQDGATKAYSDLKTDEANGGALFRNGGNSVTGAQIPNVDNTVDLGTALLRYREIFAATFNGLSTEASYADVAERFEADAQLEAGTVVMLGGAKEICEAMEELSDEVFGVVSTQPAHLMNAQAGPSETHPPIAMTGRVPVRVRGQVRKGNRLVSAGNGIARAATKEELTAWNVIGRSLEDKYTEEEGTVEAIVSMKS